MGCWTKGHCLAARRTDRLASREITSAKDADHYIDKDEKLRIIMARQ
jgi:hypothetical protein